MQFSQDSFLSLGQVGSQAGARSDYMQARKEEAQRGIVNVKATSTTPTSSVVWTYRTTGCDVVSMTTTTRPVRNGSMKDIKLPTTVVRRIPRPAKNAPMGAVHIDMDNVWSGPIERRKLHDILHEEKRVFMNKLLHQRRYQSRAEHYASMLIQKRYRGVLVRKHLAIIHRRLQIHKAIRPKVIAAMHGEIALKDVGEPILSWGRHRAVYSEKRFTSAQVIQMGYRRMLSRRRLCNLKVQGKRWRRLRATVALQSWLRVLAAKERGGALRLSAWKLKVRKASTKIQCLFRRVRARRTLNWRRWRLHWVAARLIQCAYRSMHSKFKVKLMQRILVQVKLSKGAKGVQRLVRSFICKRRVDRIRLRKIYQLVHGKICTIQKVIRAFLARHRVTRIKLNNLMKAEVEEEEATELARVEGEVKEAEEAKELELEMDVFHQARVGKVTAVHDILQSGEATINDTDAGGNTIMSIAAYEGHLDIIRRCVLWGGNVNHINNDKLSVLQLATRQRNPGVVQYITMPTSFSAAAAHGGGKGVEIIKPRFLGDEVRGWLLTEAALGPTEESCARKEGRVGEDGQKVPNGDPMDKNALLSLLASSAGYDVTLANPDTGWTVLHACASTGHLPTYKIIFRIEPEFDLDVTDDLGRTPLHLAAAKSLGMTRLLVGVTGTAPQVMDETTQERILNADVDGKDTLVHAALAGRADVLTFLRSCLSPGKVSDKDSLGWSPADIIQGLTVAEANGWVPLADPWVTASSPPTQPNTARVDSVSTDDDRAVCVAYLLEVGFDSAWSDDDGRCLAMIAAQTGNVAVLNLMLNSGADFSQTDKLMRNCVVYACRCKSSEGLSTIFTHSNREVCNVKSSLISIPDLQGRTALHAAAEANVEITIDLLARDGIEEALTTYDVDGYTPLLRACFMNSQASIKNLIGLGADAAAVDSINGRNALWLLYHPVNAARQKRRPIGSQFASRNEIPKTSGQHKARSAQEVKAENEARWRADRETVLALLKAGARLFQDAPLRARDMVVSSNYENKSYATMDLEPFEACDIIVSEHSFELLKNLPRALTREDCWRAVISSIRFDDGSGKLFAALMDGGAAEHLSPEASSPLDSGSDDGKSKKPVVKANPKHTMSNLHTERYMGTSLSGWIVILKRSMLIQYILRKGYNMSGCCDDDNNTMLHLAAEYGNVGTVDLIAGNSNILFEWENNQGKTAGELGAKMGDTAAVRKLFKYGADPRRALAGCYRAWLLAMAWQLEAREMNLQTGRIGDDDQRYFPMSPHPDYVFWYDTYRKMEDK